MACHESLTLFRTIPFHNIPYLYVIYIYTIIYHIPYLCVYIYIYVHYYIWIILYIIPMIYIHPVIFLWYSQRLNLKFPRKNLQDPLFFPGVSGIYFSMNQSIETRCSVYSIWNPMWAHQSHMRSVKNLVANWFYWFYWYSNSGLVWVVWSFFIQQNININNKSVGFDTYSSLKSQTGSWEHIFDGSLEIFRRESELLIISSVNSIFPWMIHMLM